MLRAATFLIGSLGFLASVYSQTWEGAGQTRNLTPDGYWHNRYFALLSMSVYGDFNERCPVQTYTEENKLSNFPESTLAPWEVLEVWNTESNCSGFSAVIPEMNKVVMVFRGNWEMENNLPLETASWAPLNISSCTDCTANEYALRGYLEAKEATNNWEISRNRYYGSGLVYSITGHGLGGMHAAIASVDFHNQEICYYSHNQGTPRVFNQAGVNWYNAGFNGEAGERAVANNDLITEIIPASDEYAHAGTTFYYSGVNQTTGQMGWEICWDSTDDPACQPRRQGRSTPEQDHYFYFTNVEDCGGSTRQNTQMADAFIARADEPVANIEMPSNPFGPDSGPRPSLRASSTRNVPSSYRTTRTSTSVYRSAV